MNESKQTLVKDSIADGARFVRERIGLVFLLYGLDLVVALLLAIPIYSAVVDHIGTTKSGRILVSDLHQIPWHLRDLQQHHKLE